MQVKAIVSMIALAAAATASHAAVSTTKTQQDLFLAVYDTGLKASFLFDTGLNASDILVPGVNQTFNVSANANFASFLNTVGANADLQWTLAAFSFQNGKNTQYMYTTSQDGVAPTVVANGTFRAGITNQVVGPLGNSTINTPQNTTGSEVSAFGTSGYYGDNYSDGTNIGTSNVFNAVGTAQQSIFKITNTNTSVPSSMDTVVDTGTVAQFNQVGGVYTLSVTTAAAVPEPESYALALIGLAAVGAIARRRAAK